MFSVAVDGPSGAGKSSVCQAAAKELGFVYVDTGALYRTIALYVLEKGLDPADPQAVEEALPGIQVDLAYTPEGQKMSLNGQDVTGRIRTPEVSMATSAIAAIPAVRAYLLGLQRGLAKQNCVLMDGRDIGTVVLPEAPLKVYLTASPEERARRRTRQLEGSGQPADYKQVLEDIRQRDYQDSHRATAPLKPAPDAVMLDTSEMGFQQSVEALVSLVRKKM
ncbi:(d)CMP kinase [bacterium D16-76]|nr:(d)CMP kinase [bacterium D16-76]